MGPKPGLFAWALPSRGDCFFLWPLIILVWVGLVGCISCFVRVGLMIALVSVAVSLGVPHFRTLGAEDQPCVPGRALVKLPHPWAALGTLCPGDSWPHKVQAPGLVMSGPAAGHLQ